MLNFNLVDENTVDQLIKSKMFISHQQSSINNQSLEMGNKLNGISHKLLRMNNHSLGIDNKSTQVNNSKKIKFKINNFYEKNKQKVNLLSIDKPNSKAAQKKNEIMILDMPEERKYFANE